MWPSCYNWVLISIILFMHVFDPQAGLLWESISTTLYKLLYRCQPHQADFASAGSGTCWDLPLYMPLVMFIGHCSDVWRWSHDFFFFWRLLEVTLAGASIRHWLWLALDYLFGTQSSSQFMFASTGPGCVLEGASCTPRPAVISTGPGGRSAKVPRHQRDPLKKKTLENPF